MPVENMEEEGLAKIPDLKLAQWKFQLQSVQRFKVIAFFSQLVLRWRNRVEVEEDAPYCPFCLDRDNYWIRSKK